MPFSFFVKVERVNAKEPWEKRNVKMDLPIAAHRRNRWLSRIARVKLAKSVQISGHGLLKLGRTALGSECVGGEELTSWLSTDVVEYCCLQIHLWQGGKPEPMQVRHSNHLVKSPSPRQIEKKTNDNLWSIKILYSIFVMKKHSVKSLKIITY